MIFLQHSTPSKKTLLRFIKEMNQELAPSGREYDIFYGAVLLSRTPARTARAGARAWNIVSRPTGGERWQRMFNYAANLRTTWFLLQGLRATRNLAPDPLVALSTGPDWDPQPIVFSPNQAPKKMGLDAAKRRRQTRSSRKVVRHER